MEYVLVFLPFVKEIIKYFQQNVMHHAPLVPAKQYVKPVSLIMYFLLRVALQPALQQLGIQAKFVSVKDPLFITIFL